MQRIIPNVWLDDTADEAAAFYTGIFGGSIIRSDRYNDIGKEIHGHKAGDTLTIELLLDGTRIILLNGGPEFAINPSVSLSVIRSTEDEIHDIWDELIDGGKVLMKLDEYPFSELYGWARDRYGMSWQLSLGDNARSEMIPSMLFTQQNAGQAEDALNYYASVFPDSTVGMLARYEEDSEPNEPGTVMYGEATILGQKIVAMDSALPHDYVFNEGVSLLIECDDQAEIDLYWNQLSADPAAEQCGWLKDKFGVSWQIVPTRLNDMLQNGTPEQIERVTNCFMAMKKFDIAELERAYRLEYRAM